MKGLGGKAALRSIWERKPVPSTVSAFPQEYSPYSTEHHPSTAVFYVDVVVTLMLLRVNRGYCSAILIWNGTRMDCPLHSKQKLEPNERNTFAHWLTIKRWPKYASKTTIARGVHQWSSELMCRRPSLSTLPSEWESCVFYGHRDVERVLSLFLGCATRSHWLTAHTQTNTPAHLSRVDTADARAHARTRTQWSQACRRLNNAPAMSSDDGLDSPPYQVGTDALLLSSSVLCCGVCCEADASAHCMCTLFREGKIQTLCVCVRVCVCARGCHTQATHRGACARRVCGTVSLVRNSSLKWWWTHDEQERGKSGTDNCWQSHIGR